ncbi:MULTISPECIES: starch-binding protein [Clostridium]|uniref:Alpha-amylase n=1 Tax=Clostridium cibarium TaxID=2762247 RepID=A0ABR8PX67_9CLOT|nr:MULTISPECIES: starch-binding protein [Clostridium]MBD7912754.1 starch-binding protein [Clostridium cibarium]
MIRLRKRLTSLILTIAVASGLSFGNVAKEASAAVNSENIEAKATSDVNNYGLANRTQDGTILHAFSWSFNTIRERMKEIADCGYSSIQVSPIQTCYQGPKQHTWEWENTYQPTYNKIGNYIVGSKEEFKAMTAEAHKYGIKIIVDIVANHVSGHRESVDPSIMNNYNLFHHNGIIGDGEWQNRWALTQKEVLGLADYNTQSKDVQNMIISYLDDCMDSGADGFRFDTAKHIELPNDGNFGGDFWPTILNAIRSKNSSAFVYGEILQDTGDNYLGYAALMGTNGDTYSRVVRGAVCNHNLFTDLVNYQVPDGVQADKIVTYVETHDTYANSDNNKRDQGGTRPVNNWQIRKGYSIIAARAKGVPLFFARPKFDGYNSEGKLEGPIGVSTDDWKDPEVVAVNKFRNAMIGKSEYVRQINNNTIGIERGSDGIVIVNLDGGYNGRLQTNLKDGQYKDQVSGRTATVSNGYINLQIDSGKTAVFYNPSDIKVASVSASPESTSFSTNTLDVMLNAKYTSESYYSIDGKERVSYSDGKIIKIGAEKQYGENVTITLYGKDLNGKEISSKTYTFTKTKEPISKHTAYIKLPAGWGEPYAYVYEENNGTVKNNASWPGVKMTRVKDDIYSYVVDSSFTNPLVIFTDKNQQCPYQGASGLKLSGSMIYENGNWHSYIPDVNTDNVAYIELPSGWGEPYVYVYEENNGTVKENASWPGIKMTKVEGNLYSYKVDSSFTNPLVIFTDKRNQYPASNSRGLMLKGSMIYRNGTWTNM